MFLSISHILISQIIACGDKTTDTSLTWTKDAQPIVEQHCVRCHNADGQGTGDFTDFATVQAMSTLMINAIDSGTMPPPAADPSCHDYNDSEKMHLPQESRDVLAQWIEEGMVYGEESDKQEYDHSMDTIENPDLVVTLLEPYQPTFTDANNPKNEYRCFAIPHNQTEPFYITEFHPIVDNDAIVHHVVLAKGNADGILTGSDAIEGVDCIQGGSFIQGDYQDGEMLGGWAPGMSPVRFPSTAGLLVRPNEYIVIQMHYYQSEAGGDAPVDQSGYAFKITREAPESILHMVPLGIQDFVIPAEEESYLVSDSFSIPVAFKIWGVFPHMHVLGSGYELSTDDQCLIASDKYDFNNQLTYMYDQPVQIEADANLNISCTWNNASSNPNLLHSPPIDVMYGERTDEEMCYMFSLLSF